MWRVLLSSNPRQWLRWHPKGPVLLAGSNDSTVWLWQRVTDSWSHAIKAHFVTQCRLATLCRFSRVTQGLFSVANLLRTVSDQYPIAKVANETCGISQVNTS